MIPNDAGHLLISDRNWWTVWLFRKLRAYHITLLKRGVGITMIEIWCNWETGSGGPVERFYVAGDMAGLREL